MDLSHVWAAAPDSHANLADLDAAPERPLAHTALTALTSELARHPGPKKVAVVGDDPGVIEHVLDLLGPKDELTIRVPDALAAVGVRARVAARSRFVTERVAVWDEPPAEVTPWADFLIAAGSLGPDPVATVAQLRLFLRDDGVISLATAAIPDARTAQAGVRLAQAVLRSDDTGALVPELERYVVRRDLVVRNSPPLHVHQLRFSAADPLTAEQLTPTHRPSSVAVSNRMHLDANGVFAAGLLGGAALLTKLLRPRSKAWLAPALAAPLVAAFFRDPQRRIVDDARSIVAASDGRVLGVELVNDERFDPTHQEWLRIAVFLSVLDVHVNRSPVAGRVTAVIAEEGGYAMAQNPAAEHNVAQYTVLDTANGPVVVAQRTGLIARRIVNRAKVGALLAKGERFGLIRFGSRTDIYLPAGAADALVAPNERVSGGETILARWRP